MDLFQDTIHVGTGEETPTVVSGITTLFPSRLPWTTPPGKSKRRGPPDEVYRVGFEWMHQLWAFMNFLDSGSPCSHEAATASVLRASRGKWTAQHESLARTMFKKVLRFCAHPRGTMERGTSQLEKLVERIQASSYDPNIDLDGAMCGAMEVDPNRVSLPETAGVLDPRDHLQGRQLVEFTNMPTNIPTLCSSSLDPPACHKVKDEDWCALLRKLYEAKIITFIPKDKAYKEGRKVIRGGLFAVPHKENSDRLINDRRPLNSREKKLGWCELPAGPMLAQLVLEKTESIRASGDDLSNYFYLIKHLDEWLPRNCFGQPIKGSMLPDLGLSPNVTYMASFRVLCMGDQNGVCIAQATHEGVLKAANCLNEDQTLNYRKVFPASRTLEGLYIDDHLVFQVIHKKQFRDRSEEDDMKLLDASRERYRELGLPRSSKKAFQKEYSFKAWGTCVDSSSGRVGAPLSKLRQIEGLAVALLSGGRITKKALQKLIGLFVHPFMHRRECMCVFHHVYQYMDRMREDVSLRMPQHIRDEIAVAVLLLPLSCSNIRWPISAQLSATDASSGGGGPASTVTTRVFAKSLYRLGERRGEYTRLDWSDFPLEPPSNMERLPEVLVETLMQHSWTSTQSCRFSKKEHINLLELEMLKQEVKDRVNSGRSNQRVVNLCDSRVVVGAWAKGRSSSKQLNHRLRSCLPWMLAGEISVTNLWVDTKSNPADFPSRFRPIPPPDNNAILPYDLIEPDDMKKLQIPRSPAEQQLLASEATSKMQDVVLEEPKSFGVKELVYPKVPLKFAPKTEPKYPVEDKIACAVKTSSEKKPPEEKPVSGQIAFKEIFAGKARLSDAMQRVHGVRVMDPVDIKPLKKGIHSQDILNEKFYGKLKREAAIPGQLWHFGLPCGSFSILQHSNGGTRRKCCPQGNNTLEREIIGNEILRRTCVLIGILEKHGNLWTLENPASSYAWLMPVLASLVDRPEIKKAVFHQCAYGLKLPDKNGILGPCKKHTRVVGNLPKLSELSRSCTCQQEHIHAVGGFRTKQGWKRRSEIAGHYPPALCRNYARVASFCSESK